MKKTLTVLLAMMLVMTLLPMTAGAEEEKKYDLGGRVVTIASWTDGTPNPNSDTYAEQMELLEHINEKYNCDLQFVTTGDWHSYMAVVNSSLTAGEKIADVFWAAFGTAVPTWVDRGLVVPLDDYFDIEDEIWNQQTNEEWALNGKHYVLTTWKDAVGHVILFNKRICAENGITDEYLYDLQRNGEWTWEKLRELAIKCTKDTNNDGKIDVYGFGSYGTCPTCPEAFVYSNGAAPVIIDEDFHYKYNLTDPRVIEAIQFCYDLYHVDQVCYTGSMDWGAWEMMWRRGRTAFYSVASWNMMGYFSDLENDEIGILMIPKGPQADDYVNAQSMPSGIMMQPMVEDKEAIAAIVSEWYADYDWKEETTVVDSYENYVFDDESLETVAMIEGRTVSLLGEVSTYFRDSVLWNDWGIKSGTAPRTFVETMEASCQASFDELWKPLVEAQEALEAAE
ncbi:MAG: extracellular solute-binding protein [Clostridiales bacterium]|nr:extracellular solute-binding protein [Clostridiales bacterium]